MAFDQELAERVRSLLRRRKHLSEKKMFGAIAFMLRGHVCCGVLNDELFLRLGNEGALAELDRPHTRGFDVTGKVMKSMVFVSGDGLDDDRELRSRVQRAVRFVGTLPDKKQKP